MRTSEDEQVKEERQVTISHLCITFNSSVTHHAPLSNVDSVTHHGGGCRIGFMVQKPLENRSRARISPEIFLCISTELGKILTSESVFSKFFQWNPTSF
jgi:hypothetical protein